MGMTRAKAAVMTMRAKKPVFPGRVRGQRAARRQEGGGGMEYGLHA